MSDPRLVPQVVRAPVGSTTTEIEWADGHVSTYPNELLRGYCPCAGCQGHSGEIQFISGGNSEISDIGEIGNYALSIRWGDGHDTGIYSYRYLRELCACAQCLPNSPHSARAALPRD